MLTYRGTGPGRRLYRIRGASRPVCRDESFTNAISYHAMGSGAQHLAVTFWIRMPTYHRMFFEDIFSCMPVAFMPASYTLLLFHNQDLCTRCGLKYVDRHQAASQAFQCILTSNSTGTPEGTGVFCHCMPPRSAVRMRGPRSDQGPAVLVPYTPGSRGDKSVVVPSEGSTTMPKEGKTQFRASH